MVSHGSIGNDMVGYGIASRVILGTFMGYDGEPIVLDMVPSNSQWIT